MEVILIALPEGIRVEAVPEVIEQSILALGLTMAIRSTLKSHPGSIHWHVRRPNHSGTLEITYDPTTHRAWFSTRAGRTKGWVIEAMEKLVIEVNLPHPQGEGLLGIPTLASESSGNSAH